MKRSSPIKIRVVLFDLDGVLVNMPDGHYEALNKALNLFGANITREEHMSYFNGLPTKKKLEKLEEDGRLPTGLRDFINSVKQKHTKEIIPKYCIPEYSKILLLEHLRKNGYKIACCSNSMKETLGEMLRAARLFDFFDLVIGNDEIHQPKPHPEIYLTAMKKLGVTPKQCIIVEDSPHGIAAGKASGARVIEVRGVEDVDIALFENILP